MLVIVPCGLDEANAFVEIHHRHHGPVPGAKFTLACAQDGRICGVAIVGRPIARHLDDGWTVEVTRLATDGTPNACSCLYAASWRAARAVGYRKLITYILATESGNSLKASGWRCIAETKAESWHREARPRIDRYPIESKFRFEVSA